MRSTLLALVLLAIPGLPAVARADEPDAPKPARTYDYLFPGGGNAQITAATGLPYAALGEISVGVGDRLAVGALVAGGPFLGGFATGINPRVDALHAGAMRVVLEAPVIWYPGLQNDDNWMLVRPMVRVEGNTGRLRVHGSVGAMWASMLGASPVSGPITPYGGAGLPSGVQQGSVWSTAGAGAALAVSPRTAVFTEGFLIMRGVDLAGPEWFALPFAAFAGVSTTLGG
ncbi:MAG TPA: hypothetical protein VGL81_11165 [Polyangiaceae bacterium]|jgi:hypothetical protein